MELLIPLIGLAAGLLTILSLSKPNWCEVQVNYCSGKEHIACEPNSFAHNELCRNVSFSPMDSATKDLIVHLHNYYRNEIAGGRIQNFPEATKLSVMHWDDTLQYLAEAHVAHCRFEHDQCRATPQYPYSGQNIYLQATLGYVPNATQAIERGIEGWFEEWKTARPSLVDKLTRDQSQAFHFTVMANDRNNRVGCGMIKYLSPEKSQLFDAFLLTCNYEYTNILGQPVYARGKACTGCASGCSSKYQSLCKS